ncbi:MAG: hypothetical protein E7578_01490, partial [Ruminococcaceae bacterium]|nr:hypothetical protein [Oscillospiraceae bacterium]
MKRIISFVLSVIMLISSTVFVVDAEAETNTCIRIEDTAGVDGYAAALDEINERVQAEGGVTVVMDVLVEENFTPDEGMFSQIVAFTGGGSGVKYNLLSYDFGANMFKAGQSAEWISGAQPDYAAIATNSFEWECGRWYELAFRFNGKKAAVYLNGICVISTEFDATLTDYFIIYPQFCAVRFDNIRICAKDYNVAEDTGTVWATEDFTGLADIDSSGVMYFDFSYTLSDVGSDSGVQPGDANGDGSVNSTDMVILRRMISGASVSVASGADVNLDGTVNTADITLLSRIIAGYIYDVDDSINVTPIFPDNSAIVEDDPEAPSEAVDNVIALIDDIGTVTYYSLSAITAAETAYAALTDDQKNEVTNYATLTAARSTYDALHAEVVAYKDAVAALPATATNTEECRNAIANCATAYATLTANGQISAVVAEKAKYDAFRAEWEKIVNEEAATIYNVIALIDDIGTVTYNSLSAITAAETAYAALTDEQKN